MNDRNQRRFARLPRIKTFGIEHADDFPPGSLAATLFADINTHIAGLETAKAGQAPARVSKQSLLDDLWVLFKQIAGTARSIARKDPGFDVPYRIIGQPSEQDITTHADALLRILDGPDAAPLRQRFIAYEMEPDFVDTLSTLRAALRDTNSHNHLENQDGVENTVLIERILKAAAETVTDLTVIMKNKYSRQPEILRAWQTASHIEADPKREKKAPPASPLP